VKREICAFQENFKYLSKKFNNMHFYFIMYYLEHLEFFSKFFVQIKAWENLEDILILFL